MSMVPLPIPIEARLAARTTQLTSTRNEPEFRDHHAIWFFLEHALVMAVIVLPVLWLLDFFIVLQGPYRWMMFFLVPTSTLAGLVLSGILAGILWCADD